jgi:NAD(P)-dependent dehydrogenase (short-subunit alcohol dehydrogenase family)
MSKLETCIAALKKAHPRAKLTPLLLDVSSFASVRQFVASFEARFPAADSKGGGRTCTNELVLLVNNAGIMACPYATSIDGLELQMATNHLGPFLLTCLLAPRLKQGAAAAKEGGGAHHHSLGSRIVNVASMAHAMPKPFGASQPLPLNKPYGSKAGPKYLAYGEREMDGEESGVSGEGVYTFLS